MIRTAMERGTNDMRWISIVLMRKINCQNSCTFKNKLYFHLCLIEISIKDSLYKQSNLISSIIENNKKAQQNRKLPVYIATVRNMGKMQRRD